MPFGDGSAIAVNVDHRHRLDGQSYQLVSARFSRRAARPRSSWTATNLLNEDYQEIAGVAMPGRWITVGFSIQ